MEKNCYVQSVPRMFEQVARQIIEFISSEQLRKGDRLPTERQLCELLEVSRASVREGLRILELLKFLESKQGGGTYVANAPPFIIPKQLLKQQISNEDLHNYFDIAITIAEKIVTLYLSFSDSEKITVETENFWLGFGQYINRLGEKLPNTHYNFLWSQIFHFLLENSYFENRTPPFDLDQFIQAISNKDKQKLQKLFLLLIK